MNNAASPPLTPHRRCASPSGSARSSTPLALNSVCSSPPPSDTGSTTSGRPLQTRSSGPRAPSSRTYSRPDSTFARNTTTGAPRCGARQGTRTPSRARGSSRGGRRSPTRGPPPSISVAELPSKSSLPAMPARGRSEWEELPHGPEHLVGAPGPAQHRRPGPGRDLARGIRHEKDPGPLVSLYEPIEAGRIVRSLVQDHETDRARLRVGHRIDERRIQARCRNRVIAVLAQPGPQERTWPVVGDNE